MRIAGMAALAAIAVSALVGLSGCGGGGGESGLRVTGRVTSISGAPVSGMTVRAAAASTTTDANGTYDLRGLPASSSLVVTYSGANYNEAVSVVSVAGGASSEANVVVVPVSRTVSVATGVSSQVSDARADGLNASVGLPANGIVDGAGGTLSNAKVKITTSLPKDASFLDGFPAPFVGETSRASTPQVPIITYGAVNVTLEDVGGNAAKLSGTATLRFPIDPGSDPGSATIPLWSLDPVTGVWRSDSDAVRDNSTTPATYRADVSHFSWWVIAVFPSSSITVRVRVIEDPQDDPLTPVVGAQVRVKRDRGAWQGRATTDSDGRVSIIAPPPGPYEVRAKKYPYYDEGPVSVNSVPGPPPAVDVLYWLRPFGTGTGGG